MRGTSDSANRVVEGADIVRAGFLPLVDSAPLVVAARCGFAAEQGIRLELFRQASWASIRDRINVGHLDVAQMLAGMPIASSLGIAQVTVPTIAPFAFGRGGNAIVLSRSLFAELDDSGMDWRNDPTAAGAALRRVEQHRAAFDRPQLVLGMVFPFSSHNYELRYWLAASGMLPDRDVRLVVIPPAMMVDSLRAGQIDGFCVGEPWASLAVDSGAAAIVATKQDIWPDAPEKVLGMKAVWADCHPELLRRLLKALSAAAAWCQDAQNRNDLVRLLSKEDYVAAPERILRRSLSGDLVTHPDGTSRHLPDFLRFSGDGVNVPRPDAALWTLSQMARWRQVKLSGQVVEVAQNVYRPDLLAHAETGTDAPGPLAPFMDDLTFNPDDLAGYLEQLAARAA